MGPYIEPRAKPWEPEVVSQSPHPRIPHRGRWSNDSTRVLCSCGWASDVRSGNQAAQFRAHHQRERERY